MVTQNLVNIASANGLMLDCTKPLVAHYLNQLEQLERLRSEDTPRHPVITLTIDKFVLNPKSILLTSSYRIPSQKKVKAEKIRKICEKFKF